MSEVYTDMYGSWVYVPIGYWEGDVFIQTGIKRVNVQVTA